MKKIAFALLALVALAGCKEQVKLLDNQQFSLTLNGQPTTLYTLSNPSGMTAQISDYGARVVALWVPDRKGNMRNVILGYPELEAYREEAGQYDGAILGRYAGMLAGARLDIDAVSYALDANAGENQLNGGSEGFNSRIWKGVEGRDAEGNATLKLSYTSPAGEMGYPGTLNTTITYTLRADNSLSIDMEATSDSTTYLDLSNLLSINLHGANSQEPATTHALKLQAGRYFLTQENGLATGLLARIDQEGPLDFSNYKRIAGEQIDHTFMISKRGHENGLEIAASLYEPQSGILMDVLTTKRALSVRSGDYISFAPVAFPDAPHHPIFPSTRLEAGESYKQTTTYTFMIQK